MISCNLVGSKTVDRFANAPKYKGNEDHNHHWPIGFEYGPIGMIGLCNSVLRIFRLQCAIIYKTLLQYPIPWPVET